MILLEAKKNCAEICWFCRKTGSRQRHGIVLYACTEYSVGRNRVPGSRWFPRVLR